MSTDEEFDRQLLACEEVFQDKLREYGVSWSELRFRSLVDRIYAKAARIRRLEDLGGKGRVDDSIRIEYIGIINYSIMFLDKLRNYAGSPLEDKVSLYKRWSDPGVAGKSYEAIVLDARDLLIRKDHDYDGAWRNMAKTTFTDEVLTRVMRIKTLLDESVLDRISLEGQLLDMLNYCAFALIVEGED